MGCFLPRCARAKRRGARRPVETRLYRSTPADNHLASEIKITALNGATAGSLRLPAVSVLNAYWVAPLSGVLTWKLPFNSTAPSVHLVGTASQLPVPVALSYIPVPDRMV
jgi:hypothetical protein